MIFSSLPPQTIISNRINENTFLNECRQDVAWSEHVRFLADIYFYCQFSLCTNTKMEIVQIFTRIYWNESTFFITKLPQNVENVLKKQFQMKFLHWRKLHVFRHILKWWFLSCILLFRKKEKHFLCLFWQFFNFLNGFRYITFKMLTQWFVCSILWITSSIDALCSTHFVQHTLETIATSKRKHENNLWFVVVVGRVFTGCSFIRVLSYGQGPNVTYFHLHYSIEPWSRKIFLFSLSLSRLFQKSVKHNGIFFFLHLFFFIPNTLCRIWTFFPFYFFF